MWLRSGCTLCVVSVTAVLALVVRSNMRQLCHDGQQRLLLTLRGPRGVEARYNGWDEVRQPQTKCGS